MTELIFEQIDAMSAGSMIDSLIAKRVMGWEFKRPHHGTCCTCQACGRSHEECSGGCEYSTDITAVWSVVEKLDYLTFSLSYNDPPTTELFKWNAVFIDWESGKVCGESSAESVSLAICRAALKVWLNSLGVK